MTANEFISIVTSSYQSLGAATVVIVALSAWLGKLWAKRILQNEIHRNSEVLEELKDQLNNLSKKDITRHNDKLTVYKNTISLICEILTEIEAVGMNKQDTISDNIKRKFSLERNIIYGNISLVSNQDVMNNYNIVIEYFIGFIYHEKNHKWKEMREKVDSLLNSMRIDLGVNEGDVVYKGNL